MYVWPHECEEGSIGFKGLFMRLQTKHIIKIRYLNYVGIRLYPIWKWDACPQRSTLWKRIIAGIGSILQYRCQHWGALPWWPGCSWLQPPGHPRHCTSAQTGSWLRLGPCELWPHMMRRIPPVQDTGETRGKHTTSTKQLLTSCKYKRTTNSYSVLLCIETKNPLD